MIVWIKDMSQYPQYYVLMFGIKKISKALGLSIHCDDCDEWLLCLNENKEILGFSGYKMYNDYII